MPPQPNPGNARVNDYKNTALMIAARDGELARVQQLLALPEHKSPKLDLANKFGWRAIHFAAKNGNVEILNALVAAGADINITTKNTSTPLAIAISYKKRPIVQRLIELHADLNIGGPKTKPLGLAFGMLELDQHEYQLLWDIAIDLVRAGIDVQNFNYEAGYQSLKRKVLNIVFEVARPGHRFHPIPLPRTILGLLTVLIEKHPADITILINQENSQWTATGYVYYTDLLAQRLPVPLMRLLLDNGLQMVVEGNQYIPRQPDDKNPILKARAGLYSPEMNALIMERFPAPVVAPPNMWKGWTRGDLGKFDIVFDEHNAINYSICPFCFKLAERRDGCMYMYHNCLEEQRAKGGFVHKELYEKYKMTNQMNPHLNNMVWWCTVCNRPCKSHVHYDLLPPFVANPTTVRMDPGADPFGNDCRGANKGGGIPEKIARYRRAREYALELQGQVDQITEDEAMKQLIEEMWKAPIARYERRVEKIKQEGRFNIPNTNFPPNVAPAPAANAAAGAPANNAPAPNIPQPQANRNDPALRPELLEGPGLEDEFMLEDIGRGVKFHHRRPDGTIYDHEKPLGRVGFEAWFGNEGMGMARNFGHPRFGRCYWPDCNAVWYPQEIEPFVDTAEEEKFLPREIFEIYKRNFNRHMPARIGVGVAPAPAPAQGGRRRMKTRKGKCKRTQRGGQPHDMFLELEEAQCLLPRKGQAVNANAKGGRRRMKTRRRRGRR